MPGLKVFFSIAIMLFVITPSIAAEFTYKEYSKESEVWRRGFVFGIAQHLSAVAQPDEEPPYPVRNAYERCLAGSTDAVLARHLEGYVARNPPSSNRPLKNLASRRDMVRRI
jgi:hypothetical protein